MLPDRRPAARLLSSADWEELRSLARANVENDRDHDHPVIELRSIDERALRAADGWWGPARLANWDWRRVCKRPRDGRVEVAIWSGDVLCGLALGPVDQSGGSQVACMEYVEGNPQPHPLKRRIIPIALATLEEFGRIVAAPEVRLLGKAPALAPIYKVFGYDDVAGTRGLGYLRKRIVTS